MSDGVDLSPYRIAYHVDLQNTPAWFEQRRPRTGTSRSTHRTSCRNGWPRGYGALNPSPHSWIFSSTLADSRPRSHWFTFPLVYHKQWNQNLFDMQRSTFKTSAAQPRRSYVWTNALSDVLFVPARELSSSRHSLNFILGKGNALILFYSRGANYEVEFCSFMLLLRRMLSVFLVSSYSQSPYFARFPRSFPDHRPCTRFYK